MYKYFYVNRDKDGRIVMIHGVGHLDRRIADRFYDASGGPLLKNLDSLMANVSDTLFGYGELFAEIFK